MKPVLSILLLLGSILTGLGQSIGGLWQGKWTSPEGYEFDFILHIDEFPDGSMEGHLTWKFIKAPEGDGYYKNKQNLEAIEYVKGSIPQKGKLTFVGYKKDDPNAIIALDQYQLDFDEGFITFSGITGHHGAWTGKMEGIRMGIP